MTKKTQHTIKIFIKNGQIVCKPDPIHVRNAHQVKWMCSDAPAFTIHFGMITPIGKETIIGSKGSTDFWKMLANATPVNYRLSFKYTVAINTPRGILIADPTIIIDP